MSDIPNSLETALDCAEEASRDGLRGMYPTACLILAAAVRRLEAQHDECRKARNDLIAALRNREART